MSGFFSSNTILIILYNIDTIAYLRNIINQISNSGWAYIQKTISRKNILISLSHQNIK